MSAPDRPLRKIPAALRGAVRAFRIISWRVRLRKKLRVGTNFAIGAHAVLLPPTHLRVGENVRIGRNFHLETNLEIGSDVLISSYVAVIGNDHAFDSDDASIYSTGRLTPTTTHLEGDNLIGFGAIIIGGVTIGHGCIVGAGSVVTRDLPRNCVCAGVPARPLRDRFPAHP